MTLISMSLSGEWRGLDPSCYCVPVITVAFIVFTSNANRNYHGITRSAAICSPAS